MTVEQLDEIFLEVKSLVDILENLLGKDIENVINKFNLRPKYGIKEKGIQDIHKKLSKNIESTFRFFNRKFYEFVIQKSIDDMENNNYLLKIFQKEYGMLVASFVEENPPSRYKNKTLYTCKKQLSNNNVLKIQFTDITNTNPVLLESMRKIFSISIYLYNSDMNNKVEEKLENQKKEIDWFNDLNDSEISAITDSADNNNLYNDKEISFIKTMVKKKRNNSVPTYNQIMWFMNLFEKLKK